MVDRANWRAASTRQDGIRPQFSQGTGRYGHVVVILRDKRVQQNRQISKPSLLQAQILSIHTNAQENKLPKSDAKRQYGGGGSRMGLTVITWHFTWHFHLENCVPFWTPQFKKDTSKGDQSQWRVPRSLGAGALREEAEILVLFSQERGSFRDT